MYAVGKLGSYITQGVYTVSGPFHPFGGAVDIIVVEQQDGTFKSSPWYVRFGKFQGVLKSKEKVVDISVDGVQSDFHMYLDQRGQAYFVRELECEEGESLFYPSSSGEDADVAKLDRRPLKSKSCNYHSLPPDSVVGNGKMVIRTGSRRSRILGLVFGRNSMKENSFLEKEDGSGVVRADSLERAEIAADLLEMKWSTNLAFTRYKNDTLVNCDESKVSVDNEIGDEIRNDNNETDNRSRLRFQILGNSDEDFGVEISSLENDEKGESCALDSLTSKEINELVLANADDNKSTNLFSSETIKPALDIEVKSLNETNLVVAKHTLDSSAILVDNNIDESSSNVPTHVEISFNSSAKAIVSVNLSDLKNSPTQETVTSVPFKEVNTLSSQGLDEEILLFGEFDDPNYNKEILPESISSTQTVESNSSSDEKEVIEKHRVVSSSINIPKRDKFEGFERMAESLPIMWPLTGDVVLDSLQHPLAHSLDSNFEASKRNASLEDLSSCLKTEAEKDDEVAKPSGEDSEMTEDRNNVPASTAVGESEAADLSNGKWRVWPFSFRRSKSLNNTEQIETTKAVDAEINLESSICSEKEKVTFQPKAKKTKKVRVLTPTPEQLASLKLKEGMNRVTFTFSTSMLGPQQVDARIFLWKWDTRIVISDVDGTITKSDVLGQFMPMVGMDWSHSGVAHLFSAIKENGYQLLFLSARAISQAYHTRQFLFNLKQDGKALPDGPVVISPDGLFPSLFREVIRRAPHEFKIACLEDIKALFPSDRSPFYAGFGNRDTDEFSYLRVGIPIGKIFIINPKGEVVVNRRVDRKSYTSLKALVHDMFPPMSSSEQEDYNSWNFWKLPPPLIDV